MKDKKMDFYGCINGKEISSIEEYNNYMKCDFYIDNQRFLEDKCKEMLKELDEKLINNIQLTDKNIELTIFIDKTGYIINTHKEKYEVEE